MSEPADLNELVTIPLRVTFRQLREINQRAGLNAFDGRARGEFIVGCAVGEPHDELLERVRRTAAVQRAQFRAEVDSRLDQLERRIKTELSGGPRRALVSRVAERRQLIDAERPASASPPLIAA